MRDLITIEEFSTVTNATGEREKVWAVAKKVWSQADFRQRGSHELVLAMQLTPVTTCNFRIRRIDWLTTDHRIVFKGKIWRIDSILDFDGGMYSLLECEAAIRTDETPP